MVKLTKKTRHILIVVCSALAGISIILAAAVIVSAVYQHKVLPRTYVAGANISNSDTETAQSLVDNTVANLSSHQITFTFNDKTTTASLADLGVTLDSDKTKEALDTSTDMWRWISYSYWSEFAQRKDITVAYTFDDNKMETVLLAKLGIGKEGKDASISVQNDALTVNPEIDGQNINLDAIKNQLVSYLAGKQVETIQVTTAVSAPDVTTAVATATKAQIESTVKSVYVVTSDGQNFTINPVNIYSTIDYTAQQGQLNWQINQTKLASYIDSVIGKKLNVKMVSQVTQSDTGQVTTQGVDGKTVDSKTLASKVITALTNKTDTKSAPIAVPIATTAFTNKTAYPNYTLGAFTGLYLDVSLSTQRITVIQDNAVVAQYLISSGGWRTPTPIGTFYIFNKISEAYSPDYKLWMPMWNGLATSPDGTGYLGYGIHALVCWDKACTNREGVTHIGTPVSHGCIRVDDNGIPWIYNNAPIGTPVVIHQ